MKMEKETTIEPARVSKVVRSSELFTAQPSSCDGMGSGGSRGTAVKMSYGSNITSGRNSKRLRQTAQVERLFDEAVRDAMMSEDVADVKLELSPSASSGCVSASLSRTRER